MNAESNNIVFPMMVSYPAKCSHYLGMLAFRMNDTASSSSNNSGSVVKTAAWFLTGINKAGRTAWINIYYKTAPQIKPNVFW